jgi:anti-sigma regulatory factor (Ser/Thr protein kinase)
MDPALRPLGVITTDERRQRVRTPPGVAGVAQVFDDAGCREGRATIEVKRLFYGDASSVGEARLFVRDALSETDAPADVVDSAVLLVSELATNVTLHARTDVRVTVRFEDDCLWAEVKDWNSRLPQACLPPEDATTGRGLQLVEAIASSWGVERDSDGKVVWFQLQVARAVPTNGTIGNGVSA